MTWWVRSRLRTKIFLAFSGLILAVLLSTLWFTQLFVSRQVQATLKEELLTTGQVFQGLIAERATRLLTSTTLLAGDFALKQVLVTYHSATLSSVARNYQQRIGVDLLWITDEAGKLLGDSRGVPRTSVELATFSPLAQALAAQEAFAVITEVDGMLFQLVAVPILGPDAIGFLVLGQGIDDRTARQLRDDTGSHVSFVTQEKLFASSWPALVAKGDPLQRRLGDELQHDMQGQTRLVTVAGERFLSLAVSIESQLSVPLYAFIQRSYDEALAPLSALRWRIILIGGGALIIALFIGGGLAGGMTAPIQTLVHGMREVLNGNLDLRLQVTREDEIGFLAQSFDEMVEGLAEKERIRDTFGRFVSRSVAEAVLEGKGALRGEKREVCILFQDIRGFTAMSERTDPAVLLNMLNQFFTEMVAAVEAEGGIVKQFTGDGVMALFGAPVKHADDSERAVRAALDMVTRLADLNIRLDAQNLPTIRIGVGIHTGEVVAGQIGPDERIEYGVVGDPVNLASRIEGLTKELQATVLISESTASQLGQGFLLGRSAVLPVKGKEKPVRVVEVLVEQT